MSQNPQGMTTLPVRQIDNGNLQVKLELRRHFLKKYHASGCRVLDCCQGDKTLWTVLEKEFPCTYWGVDQKPKPGRLKLDSSRLLSLPGLHYDFIDIDTYGYPWEHWTALLPNIKNPMTVTFTYGSWSRGMGAGAGSNKALQVLGIKFRNDFPKSLKSRAEVMSMNYFFALPLSYGLLIQEAAEALPSGAHARYFGFRISPK